MSYHLIKTSYQTREKNVTIGAS